MPISRRCRILSQAILGTVLALLAPAAAGHADPASGDHRTALGAAKQQLETTVEQYDTTRERLAATQARRAEVLARLRPLAQEVQRIQAEVGQYASAMYESSVGGPATTLLTADSPDVLLDQLTTLEHIGRVHKRRIDELLAAERQYDQTRSALELLITRQSAEQSDLATRRVQIESQIAQLKEIGLGGSALAAGDWRDAEPTYLIGPAGVAVRFALAQLGRPYQWGAAGPGTYDCSGLTMAAWRTAGVRLPHSSSLQWAAVAHIDRSQLRPGDLVFYYANIHHVALYLGSGQVIHAPTYGEDVSIAPLDESPVYGYGRPHT